MGKVGGNVRKISCEWKGKTKCKKKLNLQNVKIQLQNVDVNVENVVFIPKKEN